MANDGSMSRNASTVPRFVRPVVYLIEAVGLDLVKIGYTEELIRRFKEIRTSCPVPIQLVAVFDGTRATEAALHEELSYARACGEWFRFEQRAIDDWHFCHAGSLCTAHFQRVCISLGEDIPCRSMPAPGTADDQQAAFTELLQEAASV